MPKDAAVVEEYEGKAKSILKGELKRRGITYGQLADRLTMLGSPETERNIANKISRGSFTAAFFMMCMDAIGANNLSLET
ncbi:DUF6471 domain-containing protein (plasmid) [Aquicoccus sp. G2-2]|uniref:DUF6471 domain-containing protein n=1 Tax=Aquicoccus sp. G2-2 TaxID=3092120 RepID=UPI002AE06F28|nr:DUF6471 domain-containing protein [Aquicoccus sp. G2-2]MEA1111936.1 DUF6471 domain-containing protein [Aquicoccus sp. G2-2]